jgi:hypothetical protein
MVMRSMFTCILALACSASVGTAQTASMALVDAPTPSSSLQNLQIDSLREYVQYHPMSIKFRLLETPSKHNRPIPNYILLSATIPSTVLLSFSGISRTLDQFGVSYHNRTPSSRDDSKGIRVNPRKLCSKFFQRRRK